MASSERSEHVLPTAVRARRADWPNIVLSALAAGAVFMVVDALGRALIDGTSPWRTPRHIAALLIGERAMGSNASFDAGVVTLGLVLHAMLSLVYGMLLELSVRRLRLFPAVLSGVVFGCGLYLVNYHLMTGLFSSFSALRGGVAVSAHVMFGVTAVLVQAALSRPSGAPGARAFAHGTLDPPGARG